MNTTDNNFERLLIAKANLEAEVESLSHKLRGVVEQLSKALQHADYLEEKFSIKKSPKKRKVKNP